MGRCGASRWRFMADHRGEVIHLWTRPVWPRINPRAAALVICFVVAPPAATIGRGGEEMMMGANRPCPAMHCISRLRGKLSRASTIMPLRGGGRRPSGSHMLDEIAGRDDYDDGADEDLEIRKDMEKLRRTMTAEEAEQSTAVARAEIMRMSGRGASILVREGGSRQNTQLSMPGAHPLLPHMPPPSTHTSKQLPSARPRPKTGSRSRCMSTARCQSRPEAGTPLHGRHSRLKSKGG